MIFSLFAYYLYLYSYASLNFLITDMICNYHFIKGHILNGDSVITSELFLFSSPGAMALFPLRLACYS